MAGSTSAPRKPLANRKQAWRRRERGATPLREITNFVPRYYQVYGLIQQRLREGEWPQDRAMPTEQEFAESFGVSRVTVRKALNMLEEERLIVRQQGRGTFALSPPRRLGPANFSGLIENVVDFEQHTSVRILSFDKVELPETLAPLLARDPGTRVLKIVRVRIDSRSPFSYTTCYVPEPEADLITREALGNRTVVSALSDAGVAVVAAEQRLSATAASVEIARLLKVEVGAPLISMTRIVNNDAGRPVEVLQALYRPDRYEYRVNLSRDAESRAPRWTITM